MSAGKGPTQVGTGLAPPTRCLGTRPGPTRHGAAAGCRPSGSLRPPAAAARPTPTPAGRTGRAGPMPCSSGPFTRRTASDWASSLAPWTQRSPSPAAPATRSAWCTSRATCTPGRWTGTPVSMPRPIHKTPYSTLFLSRPPLRGACFGAAPGAARPRAPARRGGAGSGPGSGSRTWACASSSPSRPALGPRF